MPRVTVVDNGSVPLDRYYVRVGCIDFPTCFSRQGLSKGSPEAIGHLLRGLSLLSLLLSCNIVEVPVAMIGKAEKQKNKAANVLIPMLPATAPVKRDRFDIGMPSEYPHWMRVTVKGIQLLLVWLVVMEFMGDKLRPCDDSEKILSGLTLYVFRMGCYSWFITAGLFFVAVICNRSRFWRLVDSIITLLIGLFYGFCSVAAGMLMVGCGNVGINWRLCDKFEWGKQVSYCGLAYISYAVDGLVSAHILSKERRNAISG